MSRVGTGGCVTGPDACGESTVRDLPRVPTAALSSVAAVPRVLRQPDLDVNLRSDCQRDTAERREIDLRWTLRWRVIASRNLMRSGHGCLRQRQRGELRASGGGGCLATGRKTDDGH